MATRRRQCILVLMTSFTILTMLHGATGAVTFTLDQIMSAPFPSHLVASPTGDKVAWIFNDQGRRNIWVAEGPDYEPRQITRYDEDDGQLLGELQFSPDGETVVFVRGGRKNREGEHPNPTSDPRGTVQAVWAVSASGGEPWMLGEGSSPRVSPEGDIVVFVKDGEVLKVPLDGAEESTPLFRARGKNGSLTWSPDGSRIAFVSHREDHTFIGIYDGDNDSITWIAPSVDRDGDPVWSPDGKRVAFIRVSGSLGAERRRRELDLPFSIWVADAGTGEKKEIWSSPDSSGGFAQTYPTNPLMWGTGKRLIFYSEHDGWMHLYAVSLKDGKALCLTPGDFEVEHSCLSPDGKSVIFSSNDSDIDRRHLWTVQVSGGRAKRLTSGEGIEWSPVMTARGRDLVFICSTAFQPAAPAVMSIKSGERRLIAAEAIPHDFPADRLVKPEQVVIDAPDGLTIHCQLFLPKGAREGDRRPAVIFMHGGPIRQMLLGWHMRGYYHNAYALNQYLTSKGYVVLSVNFRAGIGYGRAFRKAPNQGPRGVSEYQDIVAAAFYLRERPEVDPGRIGLWGGSYGGYLTALGLARDSELFAAGVDFHGVHDLALRAQRRGGGGWGISGEHLMRSAYESSPVADVSFWYSPVLFIHGDDDRSVDFIQTTDLVQRLRKEGNAHIETLVIPDEGHGFLCHETWIDAYRAAADFFDRFLK